MVNQPANPRPAATTPPDITKVEDPSVDLSRLLFAMAERLDRPVALSIEPGAHSESNPDRWEDDAYFYLEMKLPGWASSEVDLIVTNGRAFIRVER